MKRANEERPRRVEKRTYAGELAGGLIHEIKNPLNTLNLNLQLLAEDWAQPETQRERRALKRIQRLQAEVERLNAILDDFMGFVRERKLALGEYDVNQLVDDVVTFVRPELAAKNVDIRTSYGRIPRCRLDVNLMKQALLNLILNAKQALSDSSTRELIVRTAPEGPGVRIDVIDTGKGILPDDVDKVFQPFFSTRKGGTGLGLATTRRIVEEHDGAIEVHSDHGRGSCFTIRLAAAGPEAASAEADPERSNGGGRR